LNTSSQADSRVILDHSGAHNLGTPGRNIYQNESKRWLSQAPFLSEALVDDIVGSDRCGINLRRIARFI
jgi:DNA segregation ATPase FtsK/SpoIIIE-like protein